MKQLGAASVRTAVLLRKIGRQEVELEPAYCGFTIPDAFVVGYGLDYNDDYRHLPHVAVIEQPHDG
jgi:hypoxanthine phosphoribosyltransferase